MVRAAFTTVRQTQPVTLPVRERRRGCESIERGKPPWP
jgi:hypothetical protein